MDFNTGGGTGGTASPNGSSGGTGGAPPTMTGGTGEEFDYRDPVQSFIRTVVAVVIRPAAFFSGIRRQDDFISPTIYALICYEISVILGGILGLLGSLVFGDQSAGGVGSAVGGFVLAIILGPVIGALILFVVAGIRHLLVMLIIGSGNAGLEATVRVQAYAFTTRLIWWIPIIGALVGFVWGVVLSVFGIREVHATTTGKAALVVLIPVVIGLVLLAVLAAIFGALIFTLLQQQA